ncbi:MAG: type II secretion system F family protein [Microbacteriaceae bacterium]
MPRRLRQPPAIEAVAGVTQRLAVLLGAGVAPASAWRYLAEIDADAGPSGGRSPVFAGAEAGERGDGIAAAIRTAAKRLPSSVAGAWLGLAAAWFVANEAGAPLATSLRDLATSFRALGQTQRDLRVALAGPAATARMVMGLPVVGVLLGIGLGLNTLQVLLTTVPGLACLAGGAFLTFAGNRWNRRLVRLAQPTSLTPGLDIDLMAIAMSGGGSVERATQLVEDAVNRFELAARIGAGSRADVMAPTGSIGGVIRLARRAGIPAAELLRSEAEQTRRDATGEGQRAAAALAVRLMVPLGVCVLPAFMLVAVVPLLLAIISSTASTF